MASAAASVPESSAGPSITISPPGVRAKQLAGQTRHPRAGEQPGHRRCCPARRQEREVVEPGRLNQLVQGQGVGKRIAQTRLRRQAQAARRSCGPRVGIDQEDRSALAPAERQGEVDRGEGLAFAGCGAGDQDQAVAAAGIRRERLRHQGGCDRAEVPAQERLAAVGIEIAGGRQARAVQARRCHRGRRRGGRQAGRGRCLGRHCGPGQRAGARHAPGRLGLGRGAPAAEVAFDDRQPPGRRRLRPEPRPAPDRARPVEGAEDQGGSLSRPPQPRSR